MGDDKKRVRKLFESVDSIDEAEDLNEGRVHSIILAFNDAEWDMIETAYAHENADGALSFLDKDPEIGMWPSVAIYAHSALINRVMDELEEIGALDERDELKEKYRNYSK